jgi:hypothetical protein
VAKTENPTMTKLGEYYSIEIMFLYVLLTVHLDILCNENQHDALFIINLFRQSNLYMFWGMFIAHHHQELYILYVYQFVRVLR